MGFREIDPLTWLDTRLELGIIGGVYLGNLTAVRIGSVAGARK